MHKNPQIFRLRIFYIFLKYAIGDIHKKQFFICLIIQIIEYTHIVLTLEPIFYISVTIYTIQIKGKEVEFMYHNYRYRVVVQLPNGATQTYTGMYTNLRSESDAVNALYRNYSNIVDYDIWEC